METLAWVLLGFGAAALSMTILNLMAGNAFSRRVWIANWLVLSLLFCGLLLFVD